jgi:hypothetical protein
MLPPFDPSKMDPKTLMEMSKLIRELPPEHLNRLQSIMHNMSAGYDVKNDLEALEKELPPGFREKVKSGMLKTQTGTTAPTDESPVDLPGSVRDARLTVLRAVSEGRMQPDEAEKILFPDT